MTENVVSSSLFTLPKHLISLRQVSTTFFKLNLGERYAITLLRDNYSNDILNSSSLAVNDNELQLLGQKFRWGGGEGDCFARFTGLKK